MKKHSIHSLIAMILVIAIAASLCACSQNQGSDTTGSTAGSTTAPTEQSQATEPTDAPIDLSANQVLGLSFEGNADDSSSLGNNGTLNKDGNFIEGVSGQALYFDGSTYVDLGSSGTLQPEQLTISLWVKSDGSLAGEHMITWFKPSGNYQGEGWYLSCLDNTTPLKLSVGKSAGQPMEIFVSGDRDTFFPAGEWVHIAVTYDSETHTCAIYRNGIAQTVQYINNVSEINADESSNKYIGFNSPGYNGGYCKLAMDELEIYNTVLTSADVVYLYTKNGGEFDAAQVVQTDYDNLSLSFTSISGSITLPTSGASGSSITWTSSDPSVLAADGTVTRPEAGDSNVDVILTAQITYGDHTMEKTFEVCVEAVSAFQNLSDFSMSDVALLNNYEQNAFSLEVDYLKSLDADKLLKGFCDIAQIESDASLYGGWENTAIKGHTLGHYLTAVSQAYATSGDQELLDIVNHIVDVLAQCQDSQTGYLAAIPESHYTQIENGNTAGTWVPWYTMHKVLAGLIDAYELTGNQQALSVASNLGDWVYSRTSTWSEATQATVLNVEYGGMNDALYALYSHTGSENHLSAAHSFDEMNLFQSLYNGEDVLNGLHANTTIPKILGALNRYMVLGESEEYYLKVAENFWQIVVNNHTYITGGNSEWEHFGEPNVLDAERTNCNCETCNTYNMLKLTRELFKITGNQKYANYYENTYINAILSSQNPETGMTTYFQPMATGFFKVYSTAISNFWCCTGSGMENFSKLGDSIYYHDDDAIYITRFTSSRITWEDKNLTLTQEVDFTSSETVRITIGGNSDADIVLRVPDWCVGQPSLTLNGETLDCVNSNGFICLHGSWNDGDVIEYTIPMEVVAYSLPDNENVVAFKYGPYVLSANLGTNDMATGTTGVSVTIPIADSDISDVLHIESTTIDQFLENINSYLLRTEGTLEFTLTGTDQDLVFTPHYQVYDHRYGIYFELADANSQVEQDEGNKYEVIDSLPIANDQYEFSHNLLGDLTGTGTHLGVNYRHAEPDGWFSYDLAVEQGVTNYLKVTYFSGDAGRTFSIYVNGQLLEFVTIENVNPGDFYDVYYEIPADLIAGNQTVTVKFAADGNGYAGGIFEKISTVKDK